MFNLGGGEALVIALIALIVLGPSRLPEAARTVGKVVGEVRRLSTGFQSEVRDAFKDAEADTPSSKATARRRESAPLAAAVDELNSSSDARDDLAPEPVEGAEPARPAATMAEADRGPSATAVPPPGANGSTDGNGNGQHAADEVAPEVAEALDQILADPAPAPAPGARRPAGGAVRSAALRLGAVRPGAGLRTGGETDALPATRSRHHAVSTESLPSDAEAEGGQMTLVEHLTELRKRLIISVVAVGIGMLVVFIFYDPIFDFLVSPYCATSDDCRLLQTDPLEGFGVRMRVAGYGGIALAMPVILWQLWRFVAPGLYANEKRYAIPFVASAVTLFVLGAGIAYATMPMALEFLADIGGDNLEQFYSPNRYFRLVTYMMLAFGIGFEFPILLLFLIMAGVLEVDMLRRGRRMAFVIITVVVALITPSGDPYSMLALSLPMILFYEIALRIGSLIEKRRAAAEAAEVAGPAG